MQHFLRLPVLVGHGCDITQTLPPATPVCAYMVEVMAVLVAVFMVHCGSTPGVLFRGEEAIRLTCAVYGQSVVCVCECCPQVHTVTGVTVYPVWRTLPLT